jgi:peptidoglycan-N-acetylglucosamine deacetylase
MVIRRAIVTVMFLLSMAVSPSGAWSQTTRPAVPISPEEVARGDSSRPWVSLVFNAGAGYQPAESILDTLREKEVRTTFFLMGWWAERRPEIVARIANEGHEVASHGHEVFDLTSVSSAAVIADLERADAVISSITGQSTRPLWSPSAGYRDARVRELAASIGYRPIYWTLDSGDWTTDASPDAVRTRVLNNAANGSIIVMHFDSPRTAEAISFALPSIIDGLRAQGLRLVTVSELITGELILTPEN